MERLTHRRKSDGAVCPNCTQTDIETRGGEVVQEMADKLCDYEDAEEAGLLVRLPCKPREVVWVYYPKYKEIERIAYGGVCDRYGVRLDGDWFCAGGEKREVQHDD